MEEKNNSNLKVKDGFKFGVGIILAGILFGIIFAVIWLIALYFLLNYTITF